MLKFNFYFITTDYCTIFGKNFKLKIIMKTEFKGTKGKWYKYTKTDSRNKVSEIKTIDGISICAINTNIEESESNANLISKAPEMLAMLVMLKNDPDLHISYQYDIETLINEIID